MRCVHCSRYFNPERIAAHQSICGRLKSARPKGVDGQPTQTSTKVFNAVAQRLGHGPVFVSPDHHKRKQQQQQQRKAQPSWRRQHDEFVAACRAARRRSAPASSRLPSSAGAPHPWESDSYAAEGWPPIRAHVSVRTRPLPSARPGPRGMPLLAGAPFPSTTPSPLHETSPARSSSQAIEASPSWTCAADSPTLPAYEPGAGTVWDRPSVAPIPEPLEEPAHCGRASGRSALVVLRGMYNNARHAPEAFRAEYAASTEYALALIEESTRAELEGVDVGEGSMNENALHCAAGCGCMEACTLLLKRFICLNFQQDDQGHTPLFWAARHGMVRTAELLLRHSADAQHANAKGLTALHVAAMHGYSRICQLLLSVPGSRECVDRVCDCGWTALHQAAFSGSVATCQALVEKGSADFEAATPAEGWTPLHLAAAQGHAEVAAYLASLNGGFLRALDARGRSALDLARLGRHTEATSVLSEPDEAHQRLARQWSRLLKSADLERQIPDVPVPPLQISPPQVYRVSEDFLELVCDITDLEYRLIEYVLEVRRYDGPWGAAPARVYYARVGEQRKLDQVRFQVPRQRQTGGPALWEPRGVYQFRLIGRCERCPQVPVAPWQVASEWSKPVSLPSSQREHPRRGSRCRRARARTLCRQRIRATQRPLSHDSTPGGGSYNGGERR